MMATHCAIAYYCVKSPQVQAPPLQSFPHHDDTMTVCIPESLALFSFSANICQLLHTNAITFNDCCKINAALRLDWHLWLHAFMHMGFDWDFATELCTAFRVDISHCNDVELEFMDPDEFDSDLEDVARLTDLSLED